MSDIILVTMIAAFALLPAAVIAHRVATAPPEGPHDLAGCRHCAELFQVEPPASIPGQREGGES